MAHKKGGGSSRNGRDSQSKRRGVKEYGGAQVPAGSILVRQKGTVIRAGQNVGMGRDFTLYAKVTGMVHFDQGTKERRRVNVVPAQAGGDS